MRSVNIMWVLLGTLLSAVVMADDVTTLSARQIMEKVDEAARKVSDGSFSQSRLSSCAFKVENKRVSCTETSRVKVMESVQIQLGEHKKDSQVVSVLLEPANERGIGMLTYSYDDPTKDTEAWLYLSALDKVKRMASGSSEEQEPIAVFGSEFTTEDMENGKTDEYDYSLVQQGAYGASQVWVIEAIPTAQRQHRTRYSKLLLWIDKERWLPLKVQVYDKKGNLYKRIIADDIQQIANQWVSRQLTIYNLKTSRLSNLKIEQIALGIQVDPEFLTQRTLTDFAYREKTLASLRQLIQDAY